MKVLTLPVLHLLLQQALSNCHARSAAQTVKVSWQEYKITRKLATPYARTRIEQVSCVYQSMIEGVSPRVPILSAPSPIVRAVALLNS